MAKLERVISADIDVLVEKVQREILSGSMSASLEESSDAVIDGVRVVTRTMERYSMLGGNRVSMNIVFVQGSSDSQVYVCATTSGGGGGIIKIIGWGEDTFLEKLEAILDRAQAGEM